MAIKVPGKRYGKRLERSKVFGHGAAGHKKSGYSELNMTPLVDMFVIMVLFLIANFSATGEVLMMTKDIELPEAKNVKEVELVPVVLVSATQVVVDGNVIAQVDDITREEYLNIPSLEEKLRDMKKKYEDLHAAANDSGSFKGDINIQGDKNVPFKVMKRIMYSCATAGYGNINFAVLGTQEKEAAPAAAAAVP